MQMSTRRRSFSGKGAGRRQLVLKRGRKEVGRRRERAAVSTWVPSSLAGCSDGDSSSPPLPPPTAGSPSPLGSGGPRATCSGPPPRMPPRVPGAALFVPVCQPPPRHAGCPSPCSRCSHVGRRAGLGGLQGLPWPGPCPCPRRSPKPPTPPRAERPQHPVSPGTSVPTAPHCAPLHPQPGSGPWGWGRAGIGKGTGVEGCWGMGGSDRV